MVAVFPVVDSSVTASLGDSAGDLFVDSVYALGSATALVAMAAGLDCVDAGFGSARVAVHSDCAEEGLDSVEDVPLDSDSLVAGASATVADVADARVIGLHSAASIASVPGNRSH